ncbi:hypothetical protein [Cryobacterium sp. M91]|uniref:hypothetical protein n=1 Tax=Cryobacterium sp. M91 TaxID=2048294 RepID=UPI000CE39948|nr:hypothetical protein [Cryobacterium sp. M91]
MFSLIASLILGALLLGPLAWRAKVIGPTATSLVMHSASAIYIFLAFGITATDASVYHTQAMEMLHGDSQRGIAAGKELWVYMLNGIYSVFGIEPGIAIALNVILLAALPVISAALASSLSLPRNTTAWITALVPQSLFWGVILLRESLVWFLIMISVLALAKICSDERMLVWVPTLSVSLVLFFFARGTIAVIFAGACLIVMVIVRRKIILPVLFGFGLWLSSLLLPGAAEITSKVSGAVTRTPPTSTGSGVVTSGGSASGAFSYFDVGDGIAGYIAHKFASGASVMFGPFVWEWSHMNVIFIADGLIWVVAFVLALVGFFATKNRLQALVLVIPIAFLILSMTWTLSDYGTSGRLKLMALFVMLPLVAQGLVTTFSYWKSRRHRR